MYGVRICSFHTADGCGYDRRRKFWRWQFSARFGPLFVKRNGDPIKNQPDEKSSAWEAFTPWYEEWKKTPTRSKCCE